MKNLFILIFLFSILSCNSRTGTSKDQELTISEKRFLDSLDYNILKFDWDSHHFLFPKSFKQTELTEREILECENLLKIFIADYNTEAKRDFQEDTKNNPTIEFKLYRYTIELEKYGRQYIPVISDKNEKIVYINFFCDPNEYNFRDKRLIIVMDGGNCYFQLKINLKQKKIFGLMVNGTA